MTHVIVDTIIEEQYNAMGSMVSTPAPVFPISISSTVAPVFPFFGGHEILV